ncbi:MAG: filamentous hemagglutinin N-terminal domain-containing protein [Syntrophobacteraceae bacterium]|jgi:filamentous hemagglutinin family protein|nr:filamentous hemagglutinin N-terminal domain-containing protein [Syntrophobacteraceae bacterium]
MGSVSGSTTLHQVIRISFLLALSAVGSLPAAVSQAQVRLDGTMGPAGSLSGPHYHIGSELGRQPKNGPNLFHSFGDFSLRKGESATFTGPASVENIIGRVTGGNRSDIQGLLRSKIDGANIFLINPAGVVFGPDARLDIKGSFHVSTADYLRFSDGAQFDARHFSGAGLTSAPPEAFGFLDGPHASIVGQGSPLQVPSGKTMQWVGGPLELTGADLTAPEGRIDLVSVASRGEVSLADPRASLDGLERLDNIRLSDDAAIDTSGDRGGRIRILGGDLVLDHADVSSMTQGQGDGEGVTIHGRGRVTISNGVISSATEGAGRGGLLSLEAGQVILQDAGRLDGNAYAEGDSGGIDISVRGLMTIRGTPDVEETDSGISASAEGDSTGSAGPVTIRASRLAMFKKSYVDAAAYGSGNGGAITIQASESVEMRGPECFIGAVTVSAGRGGDIDLATPDLALRDGAHISASTEGAGKGGDIRVRGHRLGLHNTSHIASDTLADGDAGNVHISMSDSILMEGRVGVPDSDSGISASAEEESVGTAGNITVETFSLQMSERSYIDTSTYRVGEGGRISIAARGWVALDGPECFIGSVALSAGRGGDIAVSTPDLRLEGGSHLSTSCEAEGTAGNITIRGHKLTLLNKSHISSETAGTGSGGSIDIAMDEAVIIQGVAGSDARETRITASTVEGSSGNAGNITIATSAIKLKDHGLLESFSMGEGTAGDIIIKPRYHRFNIDLLNSDITTEALQSDGGNIRIGRASVVHLNRGRITASVGGGRDTTGGNIQVDGDFVILKESGVTANAFEGRGGVIEISGSFLADPSSIVEAAAESKLGVAGTVDIHAPIRDQAGVIEPLPKDFVSAPALLREPCETRHRRKKQGSLLVKGRDGASLEPGSPMPSPLR